MIPNKEVIKIALENKVIVLTYESFDTDVDMDNLTQIQYDNLFGEIITVSTLMNKIGLLQADVEAVVKHHDLELAIYKADLYERYRKSLTRRENYIRKDGIKIIEPGNTELENAVYRDEGYKLKVSENIRLHKNLAYIQSFYWSVKSKDNKLNALMKGTTPEEFTNGILEGTINTIMIKDRKSVLPETPKYK